ncbi:MAG: DUF4159 domain-containing protein [Chroococcales cyanobacterium]
MANPWLPPTIQPLERLHVTDGLLMNAQRWRLAHEYHRQRQNLAYQSLNEPGIVCGLGVGVIPAPPDVRSQYRDGRWVQVQPGIAIDLYGNIIVVNEPISFHVVSQNFTSAPILIYLTIRYVDPEKLQVQSKSEIIRETFRIDEKSSPPAELELELCRLLLPPTDSSSVNPIELRNATNVFFPKASELDLRYRLQAKARPQSVIRVAQVYDESQSDLSESLHYLLQSIEALYPAMRGIPSIDLVNFFSTTPLDYDLIYWKIHEGLHLTPAQIVSLSEYLNRGGVLLVDVSTKGTKLEELDNISQQLKEAIARLETSLQSSEENDEEANTLIEVKEQLEEEWLATKANLDEEMKKLTATFSGLAEQLGTPLQDIRNYGKHHPLRNFPFLFSALPLVNQQETRLLLGGGLLLTIGNLSTAWGLDDNYSLPRETIRTAQEMGINILHFAWQRRQLHQLQQIS